MVYWIFEKAVNYVKSCISKVVNNTPYQGAVEKSLYLVFEHSVFFVSGCLAFYDRKWLYDITMMWDSEFDISILVYYIMYCMRYVVQILHMNKSDKDYNVFLTHHIMTIVLLIASLYRFTRIGVIIALSHDVSDIFLNMAKSLNKVYEISNDKRYNTLSNVALSIFCVSWVPTRIILNYNILNEIYTHRNMSIEVYLYDSYIDEQVCIGMLLLNFGLQLFWQILIVKFVYDIYKGILPEDEKGVKYKMS